MPILTLQRQMRELGRIRTGNQVVGAGGKKRPSKLETFRITSASRDLVEAAAAAYGGTVTPWLNGEHQEFEVVTTVAALDIVVPPGQPVSQWMELWSGGGCQRRCDGVTNVLTMTPCACPQVVEERLALAKDGLACKATTRLNVILPALPDLGVWRLESHGYYAAVELMGAAELLAMAAASGRLIPARLRLEQRVKKEPGKAPNRYAVPILEFVETRMADLQLTGPREDVPMLEPAIRHQLAAGPPTAPVMPSVAPPAASDLRAPLDAADLVADVDEEAAGEPTGLLAAIREAVEHATATGPVTEEQKADLVALFRDAAIPNADVFAGVRLAFGHEDGRLRSATEAQAIIRATSALGGAEAVRVAWSGLVAAEAAA